LPQNGRGVLVPEIMCSSLLQCVAVCSRAPQYFDFLSLECKCAGKKNVPDITMYQSVDVQLDTAWHFLISDKPHPLWGGFG